MNICNSLMNKKAAEVIIVTIILLLFSVVQGLVEPPYSYLRNQLLPGYLQFYRTQFLFKNRENCCENAYLSQYFEVNFKRRKGDCLGKQLSQNWEDGTEEHCDDTLVPGHKHGGIQLKKNKNILLDFFLWKQKHKSQNYNFIFTRTS